MPISETKLQALKAAHLGQVIRKYGKAGTSFECPPELNRAVWSVFRAGLIANGPAIGKRCKMVLTEAGVKALEQFEPSAGRSAN